MFSWVCCVAACLSYSFSEVPEEPWSKCDMLALKSGISLILITYAGHPTTIAKIAKTVSPFPYPRALYIAGANSGKPNPASERKHETAASAKF